MLKILRFVCMCAFVVLISLSALVVVAQFLEWHSYGNWNPVSPRYVFEYFEMRPAHIALASRLWDLPLSLILLFAGCSIAAAYGVLSRLR